MKKILPRFLIVVGLMLLSGCIFVPMINFYAPIGIERSITELPGKDPRPYISEPGSNRPIIVGITTRPELIKLLGPPGFTAEDGQAIGYRWSTTQGYWVLLAPTCFSTTPANVRTYIARFTFDAHGVLRHLDIASHDAISATFSDPAKHDSTAIVLKELSESGPKLSPVPQPPPNATQPVVK
jgi:hypothetical protein